MNNCWFLVPLRLQRYVDFRIRTYSDVTRDYSFVTWKKKTRMIAKKGRRTSAGMSPLRKKILTKTATN